MIMENRRLRGGFSRDCWVLSMAESNPWAFYIGASPGFGEPGEVGFEAHAWLKCGDVFITGEAGHARLAVVSVFSWQRGRLARAG